MVVIGYVEILWTNRPDIKVVGWKHELIIFFILPVWYKSDWLNSALYFFFNRTAVFESDWFKQFKYNFVESTGRIEKWLFEIRYVELVGIDQPGINSLVQIIWCTKGIGCNRLCRNSLNQPAVFESGWFKPFAYYFVESTGRVQKLLVGIRYLVICWIDLKVIKMINSYH